MNEIEKMTRACGHYSGEWDCPRCGDCYICYPTCPDGTKHKGYGMSDERIVDIHIRNREKEAST